jgi:hypothetical protein
MPHLPRKGTAAQTQKIDCIRDGIRPTAAAASCRCIRTLYEQPSVLANQHLLRTALRVALRYCSWGGSRLTCGQGQHAVGGRGEECRVVASDVREWGDGCKLSYAVLPEGV